MKKITITMSSEEPTEGRCNATTRDGGHCEKPPAKKSDTGRCRLHGARSGPPEGNGNAETHSLTSQPSTYYDRLTPGEQATVDQWRDSWEDRARYDSEGYQAVLQEAAVTLHQIYTADAYIAEEGVIIETVVDATESGDPITVPEENPAFLLKSRATRDVMKTLREFGVLDDPESRKAESTTLLAEVIDS